MVIKNKPDGPEGLIRSTCSKIVLCHVTVVRMSNLILLVVTCIFLNMQNLSTLNPVPCPGIFTVILAFTGCSSTNVGNHSHSCKFAGMFFVKASITVKIPGHGTGGRGKG